MELYNPSFENEIESTAHELYERSGRLQGRDLANWLDAEQIVLARHLESMDQEDEDEEFSGMPFEGSEY